MHDMMSIPGADLHFRLLYAFQADALAYVYQHREQTPDELRVHIRSSCLEALGGLPNLE